jgi:serine/threonine protein kinase
MLAGRYRLEAVLGRGGMGTVHRGRDVVLDRPVAVKVFAHDTTDPRRSDRYEQEARLLARLSHPGLVTVFDAGIDASGDGPQPYLVMEYVPGQTLADRITGSPLSVAQTSMLAAQLATALAYIHRRGIVHRDVKPANILLEPPDEPGGPDVAKLTDFGIARLVDGARMTTSGLTLGTANYLSPEQITGGEVTPASDIYSLGLVLLECLTGEVAYPGHGLEAALHRLHRRPAIPGSVPDGWARLLTAMTDNDPTARPAATEVGLAAPGLADAPPPGVASLGAAQSSGTAPMGAAPSRAAAEDVAPAAGPGLPPTQILPTAVAAGGPARRRRRVRSWTVLAGVAVAAVVVAIVVAVMTSGGGGGGPASPPYPSVPGRLGTDLHHLQQDVAP